MGRLLEILLAILPDSSGVMVFHFKCGRAIQVERASKRLDARVSNQTWAKWSLMFGGHHIGPFNKYITYDTQTLFAERRGKFLRFQGGKKEGGGG